MQGRLMAIVVLGMLLLSGLGCQQQPEKERKRDMTTEQPMPEPPPPVGRTSR
jgi:hypothetical protein